MSSQIWQFTCILAIGQINTIPLVSYTGLCLIVKLNPQATDKSCIFLLFPSINIPGILAIHALSNTVIVGTHNMPATQQKKSISNKDPRQHTLKDKPLKGRGNTSISELATDSQCVEGESLANFDVFLKNCEIFAKRMGTSWEKSRKTNNRIDEAEKRGGENTRQCRDTVGATKHADTPGNKSNRPRRLIQKRQL